MREYEAYHIHSHLTNIVVPDSTVMKKDYAKRFVELGTMHTLSSCEHGWQGDIYYCNDVCSDIQKSGYDLRPVAVCEAYFVKDRFEKDNTNAHLIIAAVNEEGRKDLNYVLSMANIDGFYYRPRVDLSLLLAVNPQNFIITTACIGGVWKYAEDMEYLRIIETLRGHFGKNFFLEVQPHNTDKQKALNQRILSLYKRGYQIIAGTDSHLLDHSQDIDRDNYLDSKGIHYPDEDDWDLTLPTADELFDKFVKQGVLSAAQIEEAIASTLIFRKCNNPELGTQYDLNKRKKIPNLYPDMTVDQRIRFCKQLMFDNYNKLYPDATEEEKARDFAELRHEVKSLEILVEEDSSIADYFLAVAKIIEEGRQRGGVITESGRGSGVSFVTNHLLGITSVNRIVAPVHMYADRFIAPDRILSGGLPDLDINCAEQTPFVQAAQENLGEWGALPMVAFGKLKTASAWKMYARSQGVEASVADTVSKALQKYEKALRYAKEASEDDEDEAINYGVDMARYVPAEYMKLVEESKRYGGIIDNFSPHPCAHLLINGDIRREIGVIRLKNSEGATEVAAAIDGETAERYGYLKLDLLFVTVVKVINRAFAKIGRSVPPVHELLKLTEGDRATWDMYTKGYTMGLNQVEQPATTARIMQYRPQNIVELSAFVAAVRPGFKSMLETFISRQNFKYSIPALDNLLTSKEIPASFLIFQEQVMKVLQAAGISASDSYDCIKAISKKKAEKINSFRDSFMDGFVKYITEDGTPVETAKENAEVVWGIIEDNANYSFNSSHAYCVALDSLYGAYLKAHHFYEFYMTLLEIYKEKGDKDKIALLKDEMDEAFGIVFLPPKFRMDNRTYGLDRETKTIMDALTSVKHIGAMTAEALWEMRDIQTGFFVDLLAAMEEVKGITKKHVDILIRLGYFAEYGSIQNLLAVHEAFIQGPICYKKTYVEKTKVKRLEALREFEQGVDAPPLSPDEVVRFEVEHLGLPVTKWSESRATYAVINVDDKYTPRISLSNLKTGKTGTMKVRKKTFADDPLKVGDIVCIRDWRESKPFVTEDGFVVPPAKWMELYDVFGEDRAFNPDVLMKAMGVSA